MRTISYKSVFPLVVASVLSLSSFSCSTVPKEVVELSYYSGKDIKELYNSYDLLIHDYFEDMRNKRYEYLDNVWYPKFLEKWREDGELIAIANGEKIWSEEEDMLIETPTDSDPKEHLETLNDWISFAIYAYDVKEEILLKSLNEEEENIKAKVKEAFDQLIIANATITAHLNSLREVQEVQDEVLERLNIKEARDEINVLLIEASKNAEEVLSQIEDADSKADDYINQIKALINE